MPSDGTTDAEWLAVLWFLSAGAVRSFAPIHSLHSFRVPLERAENVPESVRWSWYKKGHAG